MGRLISLSTMREVSAPECAIGRMVRFTGDMANPSGVGAVVAIRPATQYGPKSYDVALTDGRQFCGTFLDSSRWIVADEHATPDIVDILRAGVAAKEATAKASKAAAEQQFSDTVAKLRTDYPYLQQGKGPVVAAANIRAELKQRFSGVKFSVTTSKYSGGNSIRVCWTDGPNAKQVERIAEKYAGGWFDGMTDSYNHTRSPWTEVFGEAKYVFCERSYSDSMIESVMRRVCNRLGGMDDLPKVADYRAGNLWKFKQSGGCEVDREISDALQKHTYCV